jgi:hypothetical protein
LSEGRSSWTKRILIAALWVLSLVAGLFIFSAFVGPFFQGLFPQNLVSIDWSGYVAVSDSHDPQPLIAGVSAYWTVPEVTPSLRDSYSAAWVGIGGYYDNTLIQVGTEQDSQNGAGAYSAWYELLPGDAVKIRTISVSPRDKITASINLFDSNQSIWTIRIKDTNNGQTFTEKFSYDSSRLSAEWIVERPTVGHSVGALANFGTITFTNSTANMTAASQPIESFPNTRVVMYNRQNKPLVTVSSLSADGSSFNVSYLSSAAAKSQSNRVTGPDLVFHVDSIPPWGLKQIAYAPRSRFKNH